MWAFCNISGRILQVKNYFFFNFLHPRNRLLRLCLSRVRILTVDIKIWQKRRLKLSFWNFVFPSQKSPTNCFLSSKKRNPQRFLSLLSAAGLNTSGNWSRERRQCHHSHCRSYSWHSQTGSSCCPAPFFRRLQFFPTSDHPNCLLYPGE